MYNKKYFKPNLSSILPTIFLVFSTQKNTNFMVLQPYFFNNNFAVENNESKGFKIMHK